MNSKAILLALLSLVPLPHFTPPICLMKWPLWVTYHPGGLVSHLTLFHGPSRLEVCFM